VVEVAVDQPIALPSRERLSRAAYDAYLWWRMQSPEAAQTRLPAYPGCWPAVAEAPAALAYDALLERFRDLTDHVRKWRQSISMRKRQTVAERELLAAVDRYVEVVDYLTRRRGSGGGDR
jgi:hypothetical protein